PLVGFPYGYEKSLNTYLFRPLFLGGKRKGLQTVSGTDSFRVSSPSVEVFAGGGRGRELFAKSSLPRFSPHFIQ
ncbi:hypothetical protein, partial [Bilophila wadsworthia]